MFEIIGGNTWDIYYTVIGNEQSSEYFEASAMAVQSRTRLAASLGERETGCHGNIPQSGRTWEHGTGGVPRVPMQGAGVSNTTGLKDPVHNYNLGFLSKGQKGIILSTSGLGKKSITLPEARAAPAKMGFGTGFGCVSSLSQESAAHSRPRAALAPDGPLCG